MFLIGFATGFLTLFISFAIYGLRHSAKIREGAIDFDERRNEYHHQQEMKRLRKFLTEDNDVTAPRR